jgi:hypothetical protein
MPDDNIEIEHDSSVHPRNPNVDYDDQQDSDSDDENQEEWETEDQIESDGDGDLGPEDDEYSDDYDDL